MSNVTQNNTMDNDDDDLEKEDQRSLDIVEQDIAPMFGSLLSFAAVKTETKKLLTKNWWNIISTWYPKMLTEIYCVPPVHFYAVTYRPKQDRPDLQEPYERFGMRMYLPMQQTKVVDDEAQQRVLATFLAFAKKKGLVCFVLSNVEFQNYLNKSYETAPGDGFKPPRGIPPTNEEGEVDVMVIDKHHGVFLLEVKGTGYRHTEDMSEQEKLKDLPAPLTKIIRQLPSQNRVVRYILDDLDPPGQQGQPQKIKIRLGFLFPNLQTQLLRAALVKEEAIQKDLMNAIGATSLDQLLNCCLCLDDMPPKDTVAVNVITSENYNKIDKFWSTLQDISGKMVSPIEDTIYQQLVARFCGSLTTVKIYTERTMPRVKLEQTTVSRKSKKKCRSQDKVKEKVIAFEVRNTAAAAREMARRFSELVLLPKQIELLNLDENFVHIEGPPGTGKTLMLLLRVLTWLEGNNMVWILSLAPPSRSIIHVLYEQVKQMLCEHKAKEAEGILKKRLRVFIMTRPEKTLDDKYFERRLHKWRLRAKLKDSEINWGYPRPPTLPPVAPLSDRKVCLVLDETGMTGKGLKAFFDQVSVCHKEGCFTNNEVPGFTAGLSVWSASVEKCGRPGYARDPETKEKEAEDKDKFGVYWKLTLPLRCPPSVQRALMLVQPQLDKDNVFLFRKEDVLPTPVSPKMDGDPSFNYPADGLPVYLIAHGGHKKPDQPIWLCRECGADLAGYLKDTLQIGEDESEVSGQPLMQKDVLIVATHGAYDKYISVGGFFYSLHKKGLNVGISTTREEGDSALCGKDVILVADITSVHGLERAVVVVVPEHPNHPSSAANSRSAQTQEGEKMDVDNSEQAEVMSSRVQGGSPQGEVIMDTTDKDDTDEEPDAATGNADEEMPESHHDTTNEVLQETESNTSAASVKQMEAEECEADNAQQPSSPGKRAQHYTDPHSESEIEAALKTLPGRAQKDVFYIGSRAVCQLIIIHFGNGKPAESSQGGKTEK